MFSVVPLTDFPLFSLMQVGLIMASLLIIDYSYVYKNNHQKTSFFFAFITIIFAVALWYLSGFSDLLFLSDDQLQFRAILAMAVLTVIACFSLFEKLALELRIALAVGVGLFTVILTAPEQLLNNYAFSSLRMIFGASLFFILVFLLRFGI